jgi:DNA gyrase subunit A
MGTGKKARFSCSQYMDDQSVPPATPPITPPPEQSNIGKIEQIGIIEEMQKSYLDYAMSVIVSRALPDVRDGLKPVHRRIIYAMYRMGLRHSARYSKSAKVVGEVLGKYHPHGDSPVYEAMVRMAQDFSLRYPMIDGQGNFGSVDGDSPAAMRYTEARLAGMADELLRDLDKNTVSWTENFDGTLKEPDVLPTVIPNLLLNGASGIAVGMATQIPPHNLGEITDALIYMIDHPTKAAIEPKVVSETGEVTATEGREILQEINSQDQAGGDSGQKFSSEATVDDLIKFVKGPDFPTGASIYDQSEIVAAYATGKGRVVMRAKAEIEETRSGRFDIIVTELPFQVNKAVLIGRIADLVRDKKVEGIADLRDESDRKGMRIVIELKRDGKPQSVLNNLYKHTALQSVFNVNMVALTDGVPRLLTLKVILEEFVSHRIHVVRKRTEFELGEAKAREHILEGLKTAVDHIDEVIAIIRGSKDGESAKANLMSKFKLSDLQATAILDMQLRKLAALERKKIEDELKMIRELISYLEDLLANPQKILGVIKDEIKENRDKYGDDRRTRVYKQKVGEFSEEDLVADEVTIVTVTENGYVKRQAPSTFRTQNRGGKGVSGMTTKEEDAVSHIFYTKTLDNLMFFTDRGRVFQIKVWEIPEASRTAKGQAIVNLISVDQGEKITAILSIRAKDQTKFLFMGTSQGNVKKTAIEEYANIRKNGLISIKLDSGDALRWVLPTKGGDDVIIVTRDGQSIRFAETQVRATHRDTSGVRGINLGKSDEVVSVNRVDDPNGDILTVMANGLGKKTKISAWKRQSRGGVGIKAAQITDKTGKIVTAEIVKEDDNVLVMTSNKGQLIKIGLKDVPTLQRQTQGVILMRVKPEESVAAATVVSALDKEVAGVGLSVDEGNEVVESVTAADSDETTDSE